MEEKDSILKDTQILEVYIKQHHVSSVKGCLKAGADVHKLSEYMLSAFLSAITNPSYPKKSQKEGKDILELLINKGLSLSWRQCEQLYQSDDKEFHCLADKALRFMVQETKNEASHAAYMVKRDATLFKKLVKVGADLSSTPLYSFKTMFETALEEKDTKAVEMLLRKGALLFYPSNLPSLTGYDLKDIPVHPDVTIGQLKQTGAKHPEKALHITEKYLRKHPEWQQQWRHFQRNSAIAEMMVIALEPSLSKDDAKQWVKQIKEAKKAIEPFMQTCKAALRSVHAPSGGAMPQEVMVHTLCFVPGGMSTEKMIHAIIEARAEKTKNTLTTVATESLKKKPIEPKEKCPSKADKDSRNEMRR